MSKDEKEKLVPNLRFKGFTDDWIQEKLGKKASFSKGKGYKKSDLVSKGHPILLYGEMYTNYRESISTGITFVADDQNSVKSNGEEVVIPSSGESAIDIARASSIKMPNLILGGDLNIIYPDESIDNDFLALSLSNGTVKRELSKKAQGTSITHLYNSDLKNVVFHYPVLDEQLKVTEVIKTISKIITLEQEKLNKLKNLNDQILRMFIYKNWKYSLNYSKSTQQFEKVTLNRILKETNNKTTINNQHEILSSTNDGLYLQSEYFKRQVASKNNIGYKILERNQLVLSPQNLWLGNINFNDKYEIGIVSPSYKTFDINTDFNKYFIGRILSMKEMEQKYMSASEQGASVVRRNLNIDEFNQISLFLPDLATQNFISEFIQNIEDNIYKRSINIQKYSQIKTTLLCEMFV